MKAVCLLLAAAPLLSAHPAGEPPGAAVRRSLSRAQEIVARAGDRQAKLAALGAVARELLDTEGMGRRALAGRLEAEPEEQQREFLALFDEVIVRAYLRRLLFFREPEFAFLREQTDGDQALVRTRIVSGGETYAVDYPMRRRDGRWAASDIVVEGVSLTANYRDQFASLLRTHSFGELVERMRRKSRAGRGAP